MKPDCPFCQIVAGKAPAKIVYQDDQVTAFFDTRPVTPVHLLIVPNQHINSVDEVDETVEGALGHLFIVARRLAGEQGVAASGYRLVVNTGADAGQSVQHIHMHLLGGRRMPFRLYGED
jgi:histidine triad (HIT) family protein